MQYIIEKKLISDETEDMYNMKMYERAKKVFPPAAGRSTTLGITKAEGCYVYDESEKNIWILQAVLL